MYKKLPRKFKKIRNLSIIFSLIIAYIITFEIGIQRMTGKISPIQSNINVLNEDAFFNSTESYTYELIQEKTATNPNNSNENLSTAQSLDVEPEQGLVGNTTAEKIYNFFIANGFTNAGAAGMMGNLCAESALVTTRLQGDYSKNYSESEKYTEKIDNGQISKNDFCYNGPNGGGYGLAQWTYHTRKAGLYEYAKAKGTSISDLQTQLEYIIIELESICPKTLAVLKSTNDLREATKVVLYNYENPRYKNLSARLELAYQYYK